MSNKRFSKNRPLKTKPYKKAYKEEACYVTKYKSFNIFSGDGENRVVIAPYPMTLDEAMIHFNALAISGNN
jgi:hypothetical protein